MNNYDFYISDIESILESLSEKKLTKWEEEFVDSLLDNDYYLEDYDDRLSDRQKEIVYELEDKYLKKDSTDRIR